MKNTAFLLASALLAATTTAAPSGAQWDTTPAQKAGSNKYTLQQMRNEKFKGLDITAALAKAHMRFGTELPDFLKKVIDLDPILKSKFLSLESAGEKASVQAISPESYDSEYVIPVELGTPPQTLPLNLDTGSSDLTSKKLDGQTWGVKYGDGSGAGGIVYTDVAAVGSVSYDKQAIQVAVSVSDSISADNFFAGILGLASSSANTVKPNRQRTFIDNIKDDLAEPVFTANLKKGVPGTYNFGYINESEYIGDIEYTPINLLTPFWEINLSGSQIGKDGEFDNVPVRGIVDTGTSLLMMPQQVVDDYYAELEGSFFNYEKGVMMYPCDLTPPDFIFGVGDYRGVIPGHYMNYARANETYCYGGLQTSQGIPFSVFGDIMLKAQFVVFDRGTLQVGFANKETEPPSSS
ncbi:hypothetical protein K4F52_009375 [Lecanicillium sp. MT-2017a]|nr:hypothetical protein K4F52_009375 [Lecanicillium sp. MT-2017a]